MKTLLPFILATFILFAIGSCKKDKINAENLTGTWQYSTVEYIGNTADTTTNQSGVFKFQKSTYAYNAGGTEYGNEISGSGDFPFLGGGETGGPAQPTFINITFSLTDSNEPSNYNYMNFFTGFYGYIIQGLNNYGTIRMCMVSKDEINIRFEISQNSNYRFNVKSMVLKRM